MKRNILFTALLTFLNQLCFANDIEGKTEYLIKLAEKNIDWAKTLLTINSLIATIIAVAFISIIIFIIRELREMSKRIEIAKTISVKVEEHEKEILAIRNDIRNADLSKLKIADENIREIAIKCLNWEGAVKDVNIIKDFIWRKKIGNLENLRELIVDKKLIRQIVDAYGQEFKEITSKAGLLNWIYSIKIEGKNIDQLIFLEKEKRKKGAKTWSELMQAFEKRYLENKNYWFK